MRLIVDSNSIFAGIIKDKAAREIILRADVQLFAPKYFIVELAKYAVELQKKAVLDDAAFANLLTAVLEQIIFVPGATYEEYISMARPLLPDLKDVPFLALAFAIENDGIWSEDKHFEQQTAVKVWKTKDLLKLFRCI